MATTPISLVLVDTPDGSRTYVTVTPPEVAFTQGLIGEAIVGMLLRPLAEGEAVTPDNFAANSVFRTLLHDVIAKYGPQQGGLLAEAARIRNGHVVIIDQRTPTPEGPVPPEDIVGFFEVKNGNVGQFIASPNHALLSENGFFQLDDALMDCLQKELAARRS